MDIFKKHHLTLIFLVLLAHSILYSPTLVESCNAIDKEALLQFKRGIERDDSSNLLTWNPKTDCCTTWNKVTCDPATGRVSSISPFRRSEDDISIFVNGTLSPFLGNLTYLQQLDFYHFNQYYDIFDDAAGLRGPIPPELGRLSHLTSLRLSFNSISGPIPTSFAKLRRLENLDLGSNKFTGRIPDYLGKLSKIITVDLSHNEFNGPIPDSLGKLSNMISIELSRNELTGPIPDSLGKLSKLKYVNLSQNKLTGQIPDYLGNLSNLTYINLSQNKLTGSIPAKVLNLKLLHDFDVSRNQLSGRIPPHGLSIPVSSFSENLGLCDAPLPPCKH